MSSVENMIQSPSQEENKEPLPSFGEISPSAPIDQDNQNEEEQFQIDDLNNQIQAQPEEQKEEMKIEEEKNPMENEDNQPEIKCLDDKIVDENKNDINEEEEEAQNQNENLDNKEEENPIVPSSEQKNEDNQDDTVKIKESQIVEPPKDNKKDNEPQKEEEAYPQKDDEENNMDNNYDNNMNNPENDNENYENNKNNEEKIDKSDPKFSKEYYKEKYAFKPKNERNINPYDLDKPQSYGNKNKYALEPLLQDYPGYEGDSYRKKYKDYQRRYEVSPELKPYANGYSPNLYQKYGKNNNYESSFGRDYKSKYGNDNLNKYGNENQSKYENKYGNDNQFGSDYKKKYSNDNPNKKANDYQNKYGSNSESKSDFKSAYGTNDSKSLYGAKSDYKSNYGSNNKFEPNSKSFNDNFSKSHNDNFSKSYNDNFSSSKGFQDSNEPHEKSSSSSNYITPSKYDSSNKFGDLQKVPEKENNKFNNNLNKNDSNSNKMNQSKNQYKRGNLRENPNQYNQRNNMQSQNQYSQRNNRPYQNQFEQRDEMPIQSQNQFNNSQRNFRNTPNQYNQQNQRNDSNQYYQGNIRQNPNQSNEEKVRAKPKKMCRSYEYDPAGQLNKNKNFPSYMENSQRENNTPIKDEQEEKEYKPEFFSQRHPERLNKNRANRTYNRQDPNNQLYKSYDTGIPSFYQKKRSQNNPKDEGMISYKKASSGFPPYSAGDNFMPMEKNSNNERDIFYNPWSSQAKLINNWDIPDTYTYRKPRCCPCLQSGNNSMNNSNIGLTSSKGNNRRGNLCPTCERESNQQYMYYLISK